MDAAIMDKKMPVFSMHLKNIEVLYKSYMPFLESGGIFLPTVTALELGQKVGLTLRLLAEEEEYKISCKVVWWTPETTQGRWQAGVGLQFTGDLAMELHGKIEKLLAGIVNTDKPTYTL